MTASVRPETSIPAFVDWEVIAVQMENENSPRSEGIRLLKVVDRRSGKTEVLKREEAYSLVNRGIRFWVFGNGRWSELEPAIDRTTDTKYVRCKPNESKADNLLSLPRF